MTSFSLACINLQIFQSDLLLSSALIPMIEAANFAKNLLNSHQTAQWRTVGVVNTATMITDLDIEFSSF
jgi:hypothetical protein